MKKHVLIRGVEDGIYRRAKATAALLGISMGSAVGEALSAWADQAERTALEKELVANLDFVRTGWSEIERDRGRFAVVSGGRLRGAFETRAEARQFSSRFRVALTFRIEGAPARHEVQFGPEMAV